MIATLWIRLCLCLAASSGVLAADEAGRLFNEGNALYRKGEFAAAVARYESAVEQGIENADLFYNLGNAYFKTGSIGRALLNYERARRLDPGDEDILENIAFANATKTDRFDVDPPNAVTRFLSAAYRMLSPNGLSVWVSFTFLAGCASLGCWLFAAHGRTRWLVIAVAAFVACGGGGGLLWAKANDLTAPEAIVLSGQVTGRSGPGDDYLQVFTLHEGTKVTVERREGPWGLVRLPNGIGGWILLDTIGTI